MARRPLEPTRRRRSAAPTQAAAEQPSIASAELERRGATIRAIKIIVDNVFDPEGNPEEDKALYRFANRVHVRTRPDVIQTALLFKAGDRYEGRVLDESARALRARGFLGGRPDRLSNVRRRLE